MATINIKIIEADGIVVIQGLEFPGVIAYGDTLQEAQEEFDKSLDYLLYVRAEHVNKDQYPLAENERIEKVDVRLVYNE